MLVRKQRSSADRGTRPRRGEDFGLAKIRINRALHPPPNLKWTVIPRAGNLCGCPHYFHIIFDFGIAPTILSGASNLTVTGTLVQPNTLGGAYSFNGLNTTTLTHTQAGSDGLNLAFFVTATAIPEPSVLALLSLGLVWLGFRRQQT